MLEQNGIEMKNNIDYLALRKTARLTGLLYFIFALIGIYVFMYVQPRLMVAGNAAATAEQMLANEWLFRMSKVAGLVSNILFLVIVLLLYQLLHHLNDYLAKWMVGLVLVPLPVSIIGEALDITALHIFKGGALTAFPPEQAQHLAMALLKIGGNSTQLVTLFWGLWLIPLGLLVYKSGFIPRIFGVLLIVNGLGYIVQCFTFILFPGHLKTVFQYIFPIYFTGEIPFTFWLLLKGVTDPKK